MEVGSRGQERGLLTHNATLRNRELNMSSPLPFPPPGFDQLSREEQLDYIEGLLNYVTSGARYVEIPAGHREVLEERLAYYRDNGFEGTSWEHNAEGVC